MLSEKGYSTGVMDSDTGEIHLLAGTSDFDEVAYYNPLEGDVYVSEDLVAGESDRQIAGIGITEINFSDYGEDSVSVLMSRVCTYPETPSNLTEIRNDYDDWVEGVQTVDLESVISSKAQGSVTRVSGNDFPDEDSKIIGKMLQNLEGSRPAKDCF